MRYLAHISYDGSKFQGFQRLNNGKGVQNILENVLSKFSDSCVVVKGAGRTDAGVHALDQCIHFDLEKEISLEKLKYSINRMLPDSISINSVSIVNNCFHARHSVKRKTYLYKVYVGEKNPFLSSYAYSISYSLNLELMQSACEFFLGFHNFHNFVSGFREDYHSVIDEFLIYSKNDFIYFQVSGKSFYRYMVRSLVGALIDIGRGKATVEHLSRSIDTTCFSKFFVAPACGLYLTKIEY